MKRAFDLVVSLLGLVALAPLLLLAMCAIKFETPGPALFAQTRIGRSGRPFICYKLRTMRAGTEQLPSHQVEAAALTRWGSALRRLKLDELPQLWNVARGEMSLVGPRPCLPSQTDLIAARRREGVLDARPGITGLAQVRGIDMSDPQLLALIDGAYVRERSFWGDIRLLARTLAGAGLGFDAAHVAGKPSAADDRPRRAAE